MTQQPTFSDLKIADTLLSVLTEQKFINPTPIQHQVIPTAIEGKDIVGIAQTGTGKTLAFGIPMIQRLSRNKGQGLVLLPTRELALQVDEVLRKIGGKFGLRTAVLIGGASMRQQLQALRNKPHIIVATPGRLADHLKQKTYDLRFVNIIVLDEADRMFDIGFMPEIKRILAAAPSDRQTMLFSATMPDEIAKIASAHMKMPLRIEVAPAGTASKNVEQEIFIVTKEEKLQLLDKVLSETKGTVLVFSRTKHGAKKITKSVQHMGHTAAEIHSNRSLAQRRTALEGFKSGRFRVLVATDIAARGIDVRGIALVVNFDLPDNSEDYVHRIGRTGRGTHSGKAISFATPGERYDIKKIERLIKKTLPIITPKDLPAKRITPNISQMSDGADRRTRSSDRPHRNRRPSRRFQRSDRTESGDSGFDRNPRRRRFGSRQNYRQST